MGNNTKTDGYRLKFFSVPAAIGFLLLCGFSVFSQNIVRISPLTTVPGDRLTLGDIAEISGLSEEQTSRLKAVSLGYAPGIGMIRELSEDRIALAVVAAGFAKNDLKLVAPPRIIVRRRAQLLDQERLREAVEESLLTDLQSKNVMARIVRLELPPNIQIPFGKPEIRVIRPAAGTDLFAPFSISLEIRVDEKVARRVSATVQVEATAEVLVAVRDLAAGDKIAGIDVKKESRRLERAPDNYLRDPARLRGNVLLKNLSSGQVLTADAVAAGYVIRAGDLIRIVGQSGKMQIIVNGEARSSGRIGDRIAVKNLQSGKNLQAVVVDEGLVTVLF